ncbi:unnamed protein product [Fusarium graminearum]|uniref:Chromosome 1, complete genome n=1 Tax=Gibberella zeae (strain ATCC MYA-4620 / CBS 123657 / FGSC 9075 / NRRL 31084 / PH-1) TaxID=229533 RepID=A0A0E0RPZ6_GIBZE|nr:hypothetical protein FG05_35400 [Fusarium graminearum]CEF73321.1 unnamed protein product [Fusarium graminearum]CZS76592.1 unnamed protein product [Fusarium graminearum]
MSNSKLQRPDMVLIRKLYPYLCEDKRRRTLSFDRVTDRTKSIFIRIKPSMVKGSPSISKFTTSTKIFQPGSSPRNANPSLSTD